MGTDQHRPSVIEFIHPFTFEVVLVSSVDNDVSTIGEHRLIVLDLGVNAVGAGFFQLLLGKVPSLPVIIDFFEDLTRP